MNIEQGVSPFLNNNNRINGGILIMIYSFIDKMDELEQEQMIQMDATLEDSRNVLTWDEVDPKIFDYKFNSYKCWSRLQSGVNPINGNFILQSKTWFYKLQIKVKNTCYVKHAWCSDKTGSGGFINIDTTYSAGDIINLYMVRLIELKAEAEDIEIIACYIPPFVNFWNITGATEEEQKVNKEKYLISNQITVLNSGYIWFQNGLPKFVTDATVADALKIETERKESDLYLWCVEDVFGNQTGDVFYIFKDSNYKHLGRVSLPAWFESGDM